MREVVELEAVIWVFTAIIFLYIVLVVGGVYALNYKHRKELNDLKKFYETKFSNMDADVHEITENGDVRIFDDALPAKKNHRKR